MGKTLTILAGPPTANAAPNAEIDGIRAVLRPGYVTASSVADIYDILEQAGTALDLIQIIGHGSPGFLALGYSWTQKYGESAAGPVYVLDSNPYTYGLLRELVAATTEVALIGCTTGSATPPRSSAADGPTLLSDLARMWQCTVMAPDVYVVPEMFVDGIYRGPLAVSDGTHRPGNVPTFAQAPASERPTFQALTTIPVLGPLDQQAPIELDDETATSLREGFAVRVALPPLLAFPEVTFDVEWMGRTCRAEAIMNLRYLRVFWGSELVYLTAKPQGTTSLRSTLQRLIDQATPA